jgi:parallel beta-helix repeat protein
MHIRLFLALVLFASAALAESKTIRVPEDVPTIQAAIAAASAGDIVQVGVGTYEESLHFKSGIELRGTSAETTFVSVPSAKGEALKIEGAESGTITGCTFRHSDASSLNPKRKDFPDVVRIADSKIILTKCRFGPGAGCGVNISGAGEAQIAECEATGNAQHGITAKGPGAIILRETACRGNAWHGLCLWEGVQAQVDKDTFSDNSRDGVQAVDPKTDAQLTGNTCENNGRTGIRADNRSTGKMLDNVCRGNRNGGIYIARGSVFTLERNRCEKNQGHGIEIGITTTQATLVGNVCQENTQNGIAFVSGATGSARDNHCVKNNWSGIGASHWGTEVAIENNECASNTYYGIYLGIGCKASAKGNVCKDNHENGIYVTDEGTDAELGENTCEGNGGQAVVTLSGLAARLQNQVGEGVPGWLLAAGRYDALERLVARVRETKSRFGNGQPQLDYFYQQLANGYGPVKRANEKEYLDALNAWQEALPQSATPQIARGYAYLRYARDIRGPANVQDVNSEAMDKFHEKLKLAMETFDTVAAQSPNDPDLYARMLDGGMASGYTPEQMNALFEKGTALDRSYAPLYEIMALNLLPRWHGQDGDVEKFAERAATLTHDELGDGMYALVAMWTLSRYEEKDYATRHHFIWGRVKQGMNDFLKAYPESSFHWNQYCRLACVFGDRQTASELFQRIGNSPDLAYTWGNNKALDIWRNWANGQGESPLGEAKKPEAPAAAAAPATPATP